MANLQNIKSETIAVIDSAITILDRLPVFDKTNTSISYNETSNPFEFLIDIFKSTSGYDELINIISKFIAFELPALEIAVKAVLLSNIRNLLNCAINPIISDELLRNGIVFDLRTIDVMGMLYYCPLDNTHIGKRYYFGCDGFEYPAQLEHAGDFNAFLWFVKNKGINRSVWYGVDLFDATFNDSAYDFDYDPYNPAVSNGDGIMLQKEAVPAPSPGQVKCQKGCGIITLNYQERPIQLKDAEGNVRNLQTPYSNCLQVFIGYARPNVDTPDDLVYYYTQLNANITQIEKLESQIADIDIEIAENTTAILEKKISTPEGEEIYQGLYNKKNTLVYELDRLIELNNNISKTLKEIEVAYYQSVVNADPTSYLFLRQNYYYHRTLMEFNTDYVMSLKLFDSKVVIAQLLDALTGCLSMDLHFSYEQLIIKNEVEKMVKAVIETDDAVISDCFFTFSNEQYDNLVRKAELMRAGLFTIDGEENGVIEINAEQILESLNSLNTASSKQEINDIISGSLREISKTISETSEETQTKINFNVRMNFIENVLSNLAYIITYAIVSPKLYLLFAVNLHILGLNSNFSLQDFLDMHRQMLVECIRQIRDKIIGYIVAELLKIISNLALEVTAKYTIEQVEYYRYLIRRLIECFRSHRGILDFNIDNVDYADILEENGEARNDNC